VFGRSGLPCLRQRFQSYQLAERDYSDRTSILVHHWQAGDPPLGHLLRNIGDALACKAIEHVAGHRLTYPDFLWIAALRDNSHRDIAARDRAN
jgi:hypothetical protein